MGRVIAERLLQLDAHVFAFGKDLDCLEDTSSKITRITVDVSDWNAAYNGALAIGPVHGLVNNAGVAHIESFLDTSQHGWDEYENIVEFLIELLLSTRVEIASGVFKYCSGFPD